MQPMRMEDPRDKLERADRWTLVEYARKNGIDLKEDTPKIASEQILRSHGLTDPPINDAPLGAISVLGKAQNEYRASGPAVDATADFMRQYEDQLKNPDPPPEAVIEKPVAKMSINELRAAVKARGIPLSRRDRMEDLKAKLNG